MAEWQRVDMAEWQRVDGFGKRGPVLVALLLLMAGMIGARPALARQVMVDFEEVEGPAWFPNVGPIEPYTGDGVTLSGGQVLTAVKNLVANQTSVYASAAACSGCTRTITMEFAEPVSDLRFSLYNGTNFGLRYTVTDNTGRSVTKLVARHGMLGQTVFPLPGGNIRRVTVTEPLPGTFFHNFYIDNIQFEVPDRNYTVSFDAFVPHDNVPGGPTARCNAGSRGGLPPGLLARGAPEGSRARWLREISAPSPGRAEGHGPGTAMALSGIPRGVPFAFGEPTGLRRIYFAGDNRGFGPDASSYRLRQAVTVIPEASRDADGLSEGSVLNAAGELRAFAEDAMADGVIDAADEDGAANDCTLFQRAYRPETDAMSVTVTRTGPNTVAVRLAGTLDTPLAGPARVLGALDWDLTVTIEKRGEQAFYTVSGAHDGFPAWELYINGSPVYEMDPGPPPYRFGRDLRKLLPPLDTRVAVAESELR